MQVCFASSAVVNTAGSSVIEVKTLDDDVKQTIPLNRIMQGQSFEDSDTVTGVELTAHTYRAVSETIEAFKAEDSGTGENILVKFSEPLHDLELTSGSFVTDEDGNERKGVNYAYINADVGCVLSGGKYEHTQQIKKHVNPVVLASEKENISQITAATLVSVSNADDVLSHCYEWLTRTNATNLKIIVGKDVNRELFTPRYGLYRYGTVKYGTVVNENIKNHKDVNLGEVIEAETEYLGNVSGRLIQQSFNLNGNIIVKEAVLE